MKQYKNLFIILGIALVLGGTAYNAGLAVNERESGDVSLFGIDALASGPDDGNKPNGKCACEVKCRYIGDNPKNDVPGRKRACLAHGSTHPDTKAPVSCSEGSNANCGTDNETLCTRDQ